jgi:hypothetical protein
VSPGNAGKAGNGLEKEASDRRKPDRQIMRTNLATVLDPNRRSNDAGEFEATLRRKIVGQDQAIDKVA